MSIKRPLGIQCPRCGSTEVHVRGDQFVACRCPNPDQNYAPPAEKIGEFRHHPLVQLVRERWGIKDYEPSEFEEKAVEDAAAIILKWAEGEWDYADGIKVVDLDDLKQLLKPEGK